MKEGKMKNITFIVLVAMLVSASAFAVSRAIVHLTASGDYSASCSDDIISNDKAFSEYTTVNLPASPADGCTITVKDGNGDAGITGLELSVPSFAKLIEGVQRYVLVSAGASVTVSYDATAGEYKKVGESY